MTTSTLIDAPQSHVRIADGVAGVHSLSKYKPNLLYVCVCLPTDHECDGSILTAPIVLTEYSIYFILILNILYHIQYLIQ